MGAIVDLGLLSGMALPAPTTAPASNGMVLGANGLWQYPPGYLLLNDNGTTATNPTSEATILAGGAVASLWPAFVAAGDMISVVAGGVQNMVSSSIVTFRVYFGSTIVAAIATAAGTSARPWYLDLKFIMATSTSVLPTGIAPVKGAAASPWAGVATAATDTQISDVTAVTVTAPPQTFDIKAIIGTGNASSVVTMRTCQVRYYPKNY